MKKITFLALVAFALIFSTLAACGGDSGTGGSAQNTTVTMAAVTFNMNAVTIPKGSTITFTTEQGGTAHALVNGTNGQPHPESGAPDFGGTAGQTVGPGKSWTTPPWNTAGTFHVTCTYHPTSMTMTVTVTG